MTRSIQRLGEADLKHALHDKGSWHDDYRTSAVVFVGNIDPRLTEGDLLVVFEQVGTVLYLHWPRDRETGKKKSFAYLVYEDQRSTDLAVDNFSGISLLDRVIRVDHMKDYRPPLASDSDSEDSPPPKRARDASPQAVRQRHT